MLCPHHPAHTEECGYAAPTEGQPCGHEHTEGCYTADEAGGEVLDCQHVHDEDCGYVQADPGQPCGFVCPLCPIEDLIAALPDEVTPENANDVRGQLDEILALFSELTEDEQEQINLSRVYELQGALDEANDPAPVEGEVSVDYQEATWNGSEVTYATQTAESCTVVESSTEAVEWNAGWYAVSGTVTISELIAVTGAVNLILMDGCDLAAAKGIVMTTSNSLTIYAQERGTGTLNATGTVDSDKNASAGIGGGTAVSENGGNSGAVIIYGGTITANSGEGTVTGAGIGGGGGGNGKNGGDGGGITIYGGSITATSRGTQSGGAGIGGGAGNIGNGGNASGGSVEKTTGIVFENGVGSVCGDVTFDGSYAVPAGYSLHIPAGNSLSGRGTLSGGGTFTAELSADMISVPKDWHYTGEDLTEDIKKAVSLNGDVTICGKTFTADTTGWEQSVDKVSGLEYTVKYTHTDGRTISKTVTIAKGQPSLSDAAAYKADGTTPATTFGVGETIIIKATPALPVNPAMFAASFTAPGVGQMAVYYGEEQISAPSTVDENGVHTMTVDTNNLPESALNKEIALNEGRREISPESVHELADSITKIGLLNPITVDLNYTLIAGLHRLEAAKLLGWVEIECSVTGLEGLLAELAEIDENFVRKGLSKVDYGELLLHRKAIYESLHPEMRQGMRNGQTSKTADSAVLETKSFIQDSGKWSMAS